MCGSFLRKDGGCTRCGFPSAPAHGLDTAGGQPDASLTLVSGDGAIPEASQELTEPEPVNDVAAFLAGLTTPLEPERDALPQWLAREIPDPDPGFVMTSVAEKILKGLKGVLAMRWSVMQRGHAASGTWPSKMSGRAWGLYGPPGTGKNAAIKELAAVLELPYVEEDVSASSDFARLIGEVVLENGSTRAQLGKIGQALVSGGVAVINEVVSADPEIQTALHQAAQDGILTIPGPEGAEMAYRIHPNSLLFLTWNPAGGTADRPTEALTERLMTLPVGLPGEEEERQMLVNRLNADFGLALTPEDVREDVAFFREMRGLAQQGRLAREPGFRTLVSFTALRRATGDPRYAMEQVLISADQDPLDLAAVTDEIATMYLGRHQW